MISHLCRPLRLLITRRSRLHLQTLISNCGSSASELNRRTHVQTCPCFIAWLLTILAVALPGSVSRGDENDTVPSVRMDVLDDREWNNIDDAVDKAMRFLVRNQRPDGSFLGPKPAQPAVTSLGVLAILSSGQQPDNGPYAEALSRAIEFVLSVQQSDGVLAYSGDGDINNQTIAYNHAISGLMLGEAYGITGSDENRQMRTAILRAVDYTRHLQTQRKRQTHDKGGWRYPRTWGPNDSDLSVTSWQLMFYRSAQNAGFEIPAEHIHEAVGYVHRCFDKQKKAFVYAQQAGPQRERYASGGVVGGGIIALAMAGEHRTEKVLQAADWILDHPFTRYNRRRHPEDRYHYSAFYCSQAMYQIGGTHWEKFYPSLAKVLVRNQNTDGSWDAEVHPHDRRAGNIYTTALAILALTPPHQMLPIYQR